MNKKILIGTLIGFLAGVVWLIALRFVLYKNPNVHHHANFALYVNGQQDRFDNFTFYEEVQSCDSDQLNNPRTRVHLHDQVPHVAHVHDHAATWGHLFANLGYSLGNDVLKTDSGVYIDGEDDNRLTFILNGEEVDGAANRTIKSADVLLINYGTDSKETLQKRYDAIVKDAQEYNQRNDPSSCTGTQEASFGERLREAVGL